ncbi:hypothetical protein PTKIN_Ptkin03bG0046100 [Pterospermum kingtungense]
MKEDTWKCVSGMIDTLKALEMGATEIDIVRVDLDITRYVLKNNNIGSGEDVACRSGLLINISILVVGLSLTIHRRIISFARSLVGFEASSDTSLKMGESMMILHINIQSKSIPH